LKSIAHHYQNHMELMDHWKNLFPGSIHNISYEELVENQRENTQKLLEFCNLPWQEQCMDFQHAERISRTASNYQIKQSLFRKGMNRWVPYAKHLKEVADILSIDISPQMRDHARHDRTTD
jgi:hypothetical protein